MTFDVTFDVNHHTRAHLYKMSQSEDEAVEDETEWTSILVDSLSVSPGTSATGKVKAKGKHEGWRGRWFCGV